jgi:hypothetical protein
LELSGDYVAAEELKQKAYRQSEEYIKLESAALDGNAGALQAMWDLEQKEAVAMITTSNQKSEAMRGYAESIATTQDMVSALTGDEVKSMQEQRKGMDDLSRMRDALTLASTKGIQS